jgi:hypothetical protein
MAAVFLTVTIAPASVITDSLAVERSLSEQLFLDRVNLVCFDLAAELSSGITMNTQSVSNDLFAAQQAGSDSETISEASLDFQDSFGGNVSGSVLLSAVAGLPTNPGAWLLAVSPWIWSMIIWHSRPPWRRRIRRHRYVE